MTMLAIPLYTSFALQTAYNFLLFSAIISVPFFFSGIAVCLALTRMPFPMGRIYFADLTGAAAGCVGSVVLLELVDAPSAVFMISALLFCSGALYSAYANETRLTKTAGCWALAMAVLSLLNASTFHGIQPMWSKGKVDPRRDILAERWNPISRVRAQHPVSGAPMMWGASPKLPSSMQVEAIELTIDSDADTPMSRFQGDLSAFPFLRYDVTSVGAQLRQGRDSAAIIGVGGGRDVLNAAANGIRRIVGIEVNGAIVDMTSRRFDWFSGFSRIPGFELHNDEGRSYLTRSGERFDLIQASLVDTWAATSAGAMTLSENALYTVDGWRVFYNHLKPGGVITFSRWSSGAETYRLFAVAKAMLLAEGVASPERHLAAITSGNIVTLLASNLPFSESDLRKLREIMNQMEFQPLYLPGEGTGVPELRNILAARDLKQMAALRGASGLDYSPVFDASPYFFNAVHLASLPATIRTHQGIGNLRAMLFLFAFMLAAVILVIATIVLPALRWTRRQLKVKAPPAGGLAYFIAIGLGFMFVEMAMMQQLSIFLGHPIYSMVVVLAGLIFSTGIGSLASDRLRLDSNWRGRLPAIMGSLLVVLYSFAVLPVVHAFTAGVLWQRAVISLALVTPCGFLLGFCFPVGMRWMAVLRQERNLPWMWALNGAAGTLGSFVAIVLSMETSIRTCVLAGAACYFLAGCVLPAKTKA
jgi:predicted membrane-bound spermidine synthase